MVVVFIRVKITPELENFSDSISAINIGLNRPQTKSELKNRERRFSFSHHHSFLQILHVYPMLQISPGIGDYQIDFSAIFAHIY